MGRLHSEGFDRGPIWAERVDVDTSTFSGILSALDDNVQHALETIDQNTAAAADFLRLDCTNAPTTGLLTLDQGIRDTRTSLTTHQIVGMNNSATTGIYYSKTPVSRTITFKIDDVAIFWHDHFRSR